MREYRLASEPAVVAVPFGYGATIVAVVKAGAEAVVIEGEMRPFALKVNVFAYFTNVELEPDIAKPGLARQMFRAKLSSYISVCNFS